MREQEDLQRITKNITRELAQVYSAQNEILSALPDLINSTETWELKEVMLSYLRRTQLQLSRMERAGRTLGETIVSTSSAPVRGILVEYDNVVDGDGEAYMHDLVLAALLGRLVHYQLGAYPALIRMAEYTGQEQLIGLLQKGADDETAAEEAFRDIIEDLLSLQCGGLEGDEADDEDDDDDEDEDEDEDEDDDDDEEDLEDDELEEETLDDEESEEDEQAGSETESTEPRRTRIM